MKPSFEDLMLEFETIFEAAITVDNARTRRILLAEASMTLSKARDIWHDEIEILRSRAESLRDARLADADLISDRREARHAAPRVSQMFPRHATPRP